VQRRVFSREELAFLVGVPAAWGVLLLFHPSADVKTLYEDVHDEVTAMLVVHIGTMLFIPLMAVAFYVLVRGVEGPAALVCRIALVPFVIFYSAWEVLQGIATGILIHEVNGRPESERAAGADLVREFAESPLARDLGVFASIGGLGLITAAIAAGIALRRHAGAPLSVAVLLGVSGFLINAHPPPFGPIGLALFILAVLLFARSQAQTSAITPRPASASGEPPRSTGRIRFFSCEAAVAALHGGCRANPGAPLSLVEE
jgi:hypothetical protein